ncbi:hypothetical protein [Pseudomonas sp. RA_5y_Pfl1_P24]|uniref:hypothetical protein n=1 Tax=Pseudomonas sp. RA_5y_Pfl1_P24 TaxID=3088706 RepID=UPI0030DB087E
MNAEQQNPGHVPGFCVYGMSRSTMSGGENNTISEVGIRKVAAILEGLGYELTAIPKRRRKTLDEFKSVSFHD